MPQTRFVLGKAMELGHKIIVVINKIDRPDARLEEVEEEVLELLLELDATDEQLDSPMIFCSGRGHRTLSPYERESISILCSTRSSTTSPAPEGDSDAPLQLRFLDRLQRLRRTYRNRTHRARHGEDRR